jgi:hypothetical protein
LAYDQRNHQIITDDAAWYIRNYLEEGFSLENIGYRFPQTFLSLFFDCILNLTLVILTNEIVFLVDSLCLLTIVKYTFTF